MNVARPDEPEPGLVWAKVVSTAATAALMIQAFSPLRRQPPATFSAVIVRLARSLPCSGSVKAPQPISSPASMGGTSRADTDGSARPPEPWHCDD